MSRLWGSDYPHLEDTYPNTRAALAGIVDGVPEATRADETVLERFPAVRLDHLNKRYYQGLLRRELLVNRCLACGAWHTPLRPICPACWSADLRPTAVSGRGTVYALTLLHQGPPAPGVNYATPFPLAAVELVEQPGLRVESTLVDWAREDLRIGLEVELTWIDREGAPWPAFRPVARGKQRAPDAAAPGPGGGA
ncbi:MAG TPA: OB-fold domain-containing protein [Streptosporangiaceae bacterium]